MTTASDLPLSSKQIPPAPAEPGLDPYPAEPARPLLSVVPAQPTPDEAVELDEALRKAGPRLIRYAARRLHDEHEAQEVVQEALLRAFQHRHLLATEDDLMAWLTVVTGRLVIDRLRVRGRSTPVAELPPTSRTGRDTADVVVARDEARIALDSLEAMPGRQASVLWAREVEGLSYDEIGERFGMSEPSVRSLLHRARRTLRREYSARGGTMPAVGLIALAPWLHGMRAAGRLRHIARRGASAAAVAATGLAVATVVPFGAHSHPTTKAPAMQPALRIKAASQHVRHAAAPATSPRVTPAAHDTEHIRPTSFPWHGAPSVCGGHAAGYNVSAGCDVHHNPTIRVRLPIDVAGTNGVGISKEGQLCPLVPTTAVTECDTASSQPSKGNTP
ncbi:MAG TPA: RNA polymerase sigma factor [Mycobacteriales bacterium]|nr:RNA polymerase sigma factor [Mycobacteriales bacterium]